MTEAGSHAPISAAGLGALIRAALERPEAARVAGARMLSDQGALTCVHMVLRRRGRRLERLWVNGRGAWPTLLDALHHAGQVSRQARQSPDLLEICVSGRFRRLPDNDPRRLRRHETGLVGLLLEHRDRRAGIAPTEMIASNRDLRASAQRLLELNGLVPGELRKGEGQLLLFDACQLLVHLGMPQRVSPLERGTTFIAPSAISRAEVERMADAMSTWMRCQLRADGRMVYKYWPSQGRESDADNTIRQWMATICLNRISRGADPEVRRLADRNLERNLAAYYREEAGLGLIVEGGKVKLGAIALAALALHEHPERQRYGGVLGKLRQTVDFLWNADGSFRTFHAPAGRNDNQNFYPGEALLLWSALLDETADGALRERFMASYRHYRRWFEDRPNPAFVPWHTQAYCRVLGQVEHPELRAFVFRMNDWLLEMQQWESAPQRDLMGRFYNPARPDFGPPHASSTGVYLEGLADAFALARRYGDAARAERYRTAIVRGLRSLRQLQFRTDDDMFYIARRDRVFGGVRTEVYDNTIRVDNVQHGLMAILKVLALFDEADFEPGTH